MTVISGQVVDHTNSGLDKAPVYLSAQRGAKTILKNTTTDPKGAFRFIGLQPGDNVTLAVEPYLDLNRDGAPEWELASPVPPVGVLVAGAAVAAITITYRPSVVGGMIKKVAGNLDTLAAFPTLTQDVAYAPSATATGAIGGDGATVSAPLARVASDTLRSVLGWRPREGDTRGFVGALTQAFQLTDVDGHVEWDWSPRTYAVQTDLSGGISGAQASIHTRAADALSQSMPLLDGLYPLRLEADPDDSLAIKSIVQTHWNELVPELGLPGGPRVSRVDQIFVLLLGRPIETDPNRVAGDIGTLRDEFGFRAGKDFVNTLEEEQNLTNFRILTDYTTGLRETWRNNRHFFTRQSSQVFFGTQLVLLSRQLSVVSESVDEVRYALNSVFIGPSERETIELVFSNGSVMFIEELLTWVQSFSTEEGPRLIQDGGKFAVQNSFLPVAERLLRLVREAGAPANPPGKTLPPGYGTGRVRNAWRSLEDQLSALVQQAAKIRHRIPSRP